MYCSLERRAASAVGATVVSITSRCARVAFEDGALKTVPLEEKAAQHATRGVHPTSCSDLKARARARAG